MHRIAATPGGWNPNSEGVIIIEQTPAPIVILTAADTDIQTLAGAVSRLPEGFPEIRVANLLQLQQPLSIDTYADEVLAEAEIIILRLLGGRSYWSYGLEVVKEVVEESGAMLLVLPGDDRPDPELMSHSTLPLTKVNQLWRYFVEGGVDNWVNGLKFVVDACGKESYSFASPQVVPRVGLYREFEGEGEIAAILFYRSHYLAGNTLPIDALCEALLERGLKPVPVFVSSLRDREVQEELLSYLQDSLILLNTTSFSLAKIDDEDPLQFWQSLDMPVLQVILSGGTEAQWQESYAGLNPRDVAMNVALPEVDGRIITRAISFKSVQVWNEDLETDVVVYQPRRDRVHFVADLAQSWIDLSQTPVHKKRVAFILANYPNKDGRLANGVGLDTPQSCIEILQALQQAGYFVEDIPATGDEFIERLTEGVTNDLEAWELRPVKQSLSGEVYQAYFATLPEKVQQEMRDRWQDKSQIETQSEIPIPGIQLGNIFVGIQPSRGYDRDPSLNYHAPDLEPTPEYLAYYLWLRKEWQTQAIIHVGKHGNLEWLPGKSLALSEACYPEIALGTIPHFYPFIVNDPGEGSQAKRRSQAVILDHLTPPLTRAELYGPLQQLEALIDEYYEAQTLDPTRLKLIGDRITNLVSQENLDTELGFNTLNPDEIAQFLTIADGYLCELKEAQIRDGLHIFGQCPQDRQLRDLIIAIARQPHQERLGLTQDIAQALGLDFDPLGAAMGESIDVTGFPAVFSHCRTQGDVVEVLEQEAAIFVEGILSQKPTDFLPKQQNWLHTFLIPALQQTNQEIANLLHGLSGHYIPSGASGAPTRGRPEVLPTGRNFYSVDLRAIPTETAWDVGRKAAESVIERYTQENGEYPQSLAISVWGTSTMRTGGDDVAEVLALLGVRPVWDGLSRRVVDFEILPLSVLERPRVDVTLRISGFFRDSFPNIIDLLYNAIASVASLDEPPDQNPLAAQVRQEQASWQEKGLDEVQATERALHRIFGSKPGAYGAGLQGLIEAQNWQDDADLARAYINWSSYAYTGKAEAKSAPEAFQNRLQNLQIVLHNQDNREHDLLDSDDYYQFQGGLVAATRAVTGKNPEVYFGDNSLPSQPKIRRLSEEIARVYRSRVVNPKWLAGVMRHGYKGAFEMAATLDYLFAYDATARCVEDYMYEGVAKAYLLDEEVQQFIRDKNPWALRDMAERLLEAHQRQLWQSASESMLEALRNLVNDAEGTIEAKSDVGYQ
ncbi:MAG: cobaltochelatase subunit CobN [Spirulinaceae cyanobacterium]